MIKIEAKNSEVTKHVILTQRLILSSWKSCDSSLKEMFILAHDAHIGNIGNMQLVLVQHLHDFITDPLKL